MARTRRAGRVGGSRKRLSVFKDITSGLSPTKNNHRLPVFKLLANTPTSSSSRVILNKSRDVAPEILKLASKLGLNTSAKSFKPTKGKGKKRKHKRTQKK